MFIGGGLRLGDALGGVKEQDGKGVLRDAGQRSLHGGHVDLYPARATGPGKRQPISVVVFGDVQQLAITKEVSVVGGGAAGCVEVVGDPSFETGSPNAAWDDYSLILAKDRFATSSTPRDLSQSRVDANDFTIRADAERDLGEWRMVVGTEFSGRYGLEAVNHYTTFDERGGQLESVREVSIENSSGADLGGFLITHLADQDHLRRLAQGGAQGEAEARGVGADLAWKWIVDGVATEPGGGVSRTV